MFQRREMKHEGLEMGKGKLIFQRIVTSSVCLDNRIRDGGCMLRLRSDHKGPNQL